MGRPAKAVSVNSKHLTKAEKIDRQKKEQALQGSNDKLIPPDYLTEDQVYYFNFIITELSESNILGNLDVFVVAQASICIDRLNKMEEIINDDGSYLLNSNFMSAKSKYSSDFFKCCSELCLSPQSRAKISMTNVKKEDDKIMKILSDDDED